MNQIEVLPSVNMSRGAPMGRAAYGSPLECAPRSIRLFMVTLNEGYDVGGVYWGCNMPGKVLYCATDGGDYRAFIRAPHRPAAAHLLDIPSNRLARSV